MGNWHISIQGVGCHHNKKAEIDADLIFQEFVDRLKSSGQSIGHASFTCGSAIAGTEETQLSKPWKPKEQR